MAVIPGTIYDDNSTVGPDGNFHPSIYGTDQDDDIFSYEGNDIVYAGAGNDYVDGWEGNDQLYGGTSSNPNETGTGNDSLVAWYGEDTLYGQDGDDWLDGSYDNDNLFGGDGNDILGNPVSREGVGGEPGNDNMYGEGGSDKLYGGNGNDFLSGTNSGVTGEIDILTGGSEADTFVLGYNSTIGSSYVYYLATNSHAVITDFQHSEGDKIRIGGTIGDYRLDRPDTTIYGEYGSSMLPDTGIFRGSDLIAIVQDVDLTNPNLDLGQVFTSFAGHGG